MVNDETQQHDRSFEQLVAEGVYTFEGFDEETGEVVWALDPEVAQVKAPALLAAYNDDMWKRVMQAVDEGYIELDIDPHNGETSLIFTEKGTSL